MPNPSDKLDILRRVPTFAAWLLAHGETCLEHLSRGQEVRLQPGEWLCREGDSAAFYLVLKGELSVMKLVGDAEMRITTHHPGVFFGEIPLLMDTPFVAGAQAVGEVLAFRLEPDAFWALFGACPDVAREITRVMAARMQDLESLAQTRDKLVSLGTLAAGLAHELNNPAAAAARASQELRGAMRELESRALAMHTLGFEPSQCERLVTLREAARENAGNPRGEALTAMGRADLEDELADWLDARGVENSGLLAPTFVAAGVELKGFEELAKQVDCGAFGAVVSWLEASLRAEGLALEIERAAGAISELVGAVKGYSHLDEAPQGEVDLHAGLESTLTMLKFKLRGIEITRDFERDLPLVPAHGSELNQVWTNLLDNAADALKNGDEVKPGAKIGLKTARDGQCAVMEISDNGPGIPDEVKSRIFEPFFTTKAVGSGTGLGLDIAHRIIVGRHGGDISCESDADGTTFSIRLPLEE